jgi:hypothetical protein
MTMAHGGGEVVRQRWHMTRWFEGVMVAWRYGVDDEEKKWSDEAVMAAATT